MAVGGPVIGRLAGRYGHRRVGALTAVATIAALIGLIASLAVIRAALPLLGRVTGPENARFEQAHARKTICRARSGLAKVTA